MSVIIVVVLHQFLVLHVSILLLDGIELVSQSNVVFISLLDFKDLGLELRNEEVFLVTCQMN